MFNPYNNIILVNLKLVRTNANEFKKYIKSEFVNVLIIKIVTYLLIKRFLGNNTSFTMLLFSSLKILSSVNAS